MTAFLNRRRYLFAAQLLDASSTVCLAGNEGLQATVRVDIEDPWLGAADLPEFHRSDSGLRHFCCTERRVFPFRSFQTGIEPATRCSEDNCSTIEPLNVEPAKMCASRLLRRLLSREIQHTFCLSPTGYSTVLRDPVPLARYPLNCAPPSLAGSD